MPRQPRQPDPAPHPNVAAGGIRRTRHYLHCFIATLRETGHQPEHVREVLRELLDAPGVATPFSDFIRNASPEEKAKVYGEVMDRVSEQQRAVKLVEGPARDFGQAQDRYGEHIDRPSQRMDEARSAIKGLRRAVAFQDQVREAAKNGEEVTGTGIARDAREWVDRAAREVVEAAYGVSAAHGDGCATGKGGLCDCGADGVDVPSTGWIKTKERRPDPGTLIVKRWLPSKSVWAGIYSGTDKDSSFDEWCALPADGVEASGLPVKWLGADGTTHEISVDYAAQIAKWIFDKHGDVSQVDAVLAGVRACETCGGTGIAKLSGDFCTNCNGNGRRPGEGGTDGR